MTAPKVSRKVNTSFFFFTWSSSPLARPSRHTHFHQSLSQCSVYNLRPALLIFDASGCAAMLARAATYLLFSFFFLYNKSAFGSIFGSSPLARASRHTHFCDLAKMQATVENFDFQIHFQMQAGAPRWSRERRNASKTEIFKILY